MTVVFHKSCNSWCSIKALACMLCLLFSTHTWAQGVSQAPAPETSDPQVADSPLPESQTAVPDTIPAETTDTEPANPESTLPSLADPATSNAQPLIDTQPPVLDLDELATSVADSTQVFTVQVEEDTALQDVTLFHRRAGQQAYTSTFMAPLGSLGLYSASITTDPEDLRAIEYYVQARDTSGNRTVSGFAFDPYSRSLTAAPRSRVPARETEQPVAQEPATLSSQPVPFYKKRWFQVTLGVVAVGILASSLDSEGEETRIVPITFTTE